MINLTKSKYSGKAVTRDICSDEHVIGCYGCDSSCQYSCGDVCTGLDTSVDGEPCRTCSDFCENSCTSLFSNTAGK